MSDCQETIIRMVEGLGFTPGMIHHCLQKLAQDKGITETQMCQRIMVDILRDAVECKKLAEKHGKALRSYQATMVDHMIHNPGGIAVYSTGVGKTLTAAMTIRCCRRIATIFGRPNIPINIIAPISLHDNMRSELKLLGIQVKDPHVHFFSASSYQKAWRNKTLDYEHAILIIDEAHEYRKDYKNQFTEFTFGQKDEETYQVYPVIETARHAWKRLLLTATPMYAHAHDIVNLITIATGREFSAEAYEKSWTDPDELEKAYGGLFMFESADPEFFPTMEEKELRIPMTLEYYKNYMEAEKHIEMIEGHKEKVNDAFLTKVRAATNKIPPQLKSPKVEEILLKREPTLFYSDFIDAGAKILEELAIKHKVPYQIISGKIPKKKRQQYVDDYNAGKITLLILTKAGGVGLDTKNTRHIILLEKGWTRAGEIQAMGRGVRFKSHWSLPKKQQHVMIWHLMIVKPPLATLQQWAARGQIKQSNITEKASVDELMYVRNRETYNSEIIPKLEQLESVQIRH